MLIIWANITIQWRKLIYRKTEIILYNIIIFSLKTTVTILIFSYIYLILLSWYN